MKRFRFVPILTLSMSCPPAAIAADMDSVALLQSVRTSATNMPLYAYETAYKDGDISAVLAVDPSLPQGERVTVLSPIDDGQSEKYKQDIAELESNPMDGFWCHEFAEMIPAKITLVRETDTDIEYAFKPLPDSNDEDDLKFMKGMQGRVVLAKENPAILSFRMYAPKPFRPSMIAKIKEFEMIARCARTPDGRTRVESFDVTVVASAFFKTFEESESTRISAVRAVD